MLTHDQDDNSSLFLDLLLFIAGRFHIPLFNCYIQKVFFLIYLLTYLLTYVLNCHCLFLLQFYEFEQSEFLLTPPEESSMGDIGYAYIPSGCVSATTG